MTTELVPYERGQLLKCAQEANEHHRLAVQAAVDAVEQAIAAGESLLQCQLIWDATWEGRETWAEWLDSNFDASRGLATLYMRLARYKQQVRSSGLTTVSGARDYLRRIEAPPAHGLGGPRKWPSWMRDEAKRLRQEGATLAQISGHLGVHPATIKGWLDPQGARTAQRRYKAKRRAEKAALERQKRDQAVKAAGGAAAEAYAQIRRVLQTLDHAYAAAADNDERTAFNKAITQLHRAEDSIVQALGIERASPQVIRRRSA